MSGWMRGRRVSTSQDSALAKCSCESELFESALDRSIHQDPVANLQAYSQCVKTCDAFGDGDWVLVVANLDKKLKVRVKFVESPLTLLCSVCHRQPRWEGRSTACFFPTFRSFISSLPVMTGLQRDVAAQRA